MRESLTSFETRITASELYLEGMCAISPETSGIKKVFIQLRPQPDQAHKQISIKVRIGNGHFKSMENCGVYSVPSLELIIRGFGLRTKLDEDIFYTQTFW